MLPAALTALERDLRGVFGKRLLSLVAYGLNPHRHPPPDDPGHHAAPRTNTDDGDRRVADRTGPARLRVADLGVARRGSRDPAPRPRTRTRSVAGCFPARVCGHRRGPRGRRGHEPVRTGGGGRPTTCAARARVQARSHLLHLREGFVEAGGNGNALAVLIVDSARPLAALVKGLARLDGREQLDALAAGRHAERILALSGRRHNRCDRADARARNHGHRRRADLPDVSGGDGTAGRARRSLAPMTAVQRFLSRRDPAPVRRPSWRAATAAARDGFARQAQPGPRSPRADPARQRLRAHHRSPTARARSTASSGRSKPPPAT